MLNKKCLATYAALAGLFWPVLPAMAQVHLSRGMCNFDPCVKSPVAARCEVDVSYVGVAACICPDGYAGDGKPPENGGTGCHNENECLSGRHECDLQTQTCTDKDLVQDGVPYECGCKRGFTPAKNGKSCIDIDECRLPGLNLCDPQTTTCRNLAGGYECICTDTRSRFDASTASCQNINPCEDFDGRDNPCDPDTTFCVHRNDEAQCVCRPGYQNNPNDATSCIDIDECGLELDQCDKTISRCQNEIGDYSCVCREDLGWSTVETHRKTCENLNECLRWPMICGDATPCCADLHPDMGGFACAAPAHELGGVSSSVSDSVPDPTLVLPDSYNSKAIEALIQQAVAQQMLAQAAANSQQQIGAINSAQAMDESAAQQIAAAHAFQQLIAANTAQQQRVAAQQMAANPASAGLFGPLHRGLSEPHTSTEDTGERHDVSARKLQSLLSRIVSGPGLTSGVGAIRQSESTVCPAGYRHKDEILRAKARAKTAEALKATFAGSSRASPDQVARGIVTNAGVIANEFANWYNSLANLPSQVAHASQNATNINPANDAMNAVKSGEQMVAPFIPGVGGFTGGSGLAAVGSPVSFGVPAIAGAATGAGVGGALLGGAVGAAAVKGGPGDSFLMDRTGISREVAYNRF